MRQILSFTMLSSMIVLSVTPLMTSQAQQDSDAPYIYYYSEALNGIVIERADGTDSRIIGQGLVIENVRSTYGPGWSPDGRWFAWRVWTPNGIYGSVGKGHVVSVSDTDTLSMLEDFACVHEMQWHPTDNILLVRGTILPLQDGCPQDITYRLGTYWLIDVDAQQLLATFSIDSITEGRSMYWFPPQRQLKFFEEVSVGDEKFSSQYYLVTMNFDGTVTMEPVSRDVYYEGLTGGVFQGTAYENTGKTDFTTYAEPYPRDEKGDILDFPANSSSRTPAIVSWQWDQSDEWLFVGYEFCYSACSGVTGRVSIFNPDTGQNREITECGGHPTCVGWLPDNVNLDDLPPGRPSSLLASPVSVDEDRGFLKTEGHYGSFRDVITHQLVCNEEVRLLNRVENAESGNLDFVLPGQPRCDNYVRVEQDGYYQDIPVIFALSPDEKHYAITDESEYTSLYNAETGDLIATLNIYGIKLAFSADSRYLITTGRYLEATWDIAELESQTLD